MNSCSLRIYRYFTSDRVGNYEASKHNEKGSTCDVDLRGLSDSDLTIEKVDANTTSTLMGTVIHHEDTVYWLLVVNAERLHCDSKLFGMDNFILTYQAKEEAEAAIRDFKILARDVCSK